MLNSTETFCGYVAIVGRPNVGKSTLLNRILGQKLSITSRKPQTTRHAILGVKTSGRTQAIYVDTPGLHIQEKCALNRYMNKMARRSLRDVNVVIFVVDSLKWTEEDTLVLTLLKSVSCPIILAVNKVDTVSQKEILLPYIDTLLQKEVFRDIIPISAQKGTNISALEKKVFCLLPESPHYFLENQITDKTLGFRVSEIIREKLTRMLGQEIPYAISIELELFKNEERLCTIHAVIWVERESQKPIIIGKSGERLKKIGMRSRVDLEQLLNKKVYLKLWVKVKTGWADNERALVSLGYTDN